MREQQAMKVLSLFDGMSCGQIALLELGIIPATYYASEIDKHAIRQTQLNFPDTVHLGDVTRWREWNINWAGIDLLLAGSPCQGFSFAGKQLAFDDPRSRLFFVFVDILNHIRKHNPGVKFLFENVDMKRAYMRVITEYIGLHPVKINSALVSAQNRERWYWTNIRTRTEGLFGELYSDIPQPVDARIMLKDILEDEVAEKYYISDTRLKYITDKQRLRKKYTALDGDKALTLCANSEKSWAGTYIMQLPRGQNNGGMHVEKSPTLSANAWEQNNLVVLGNIYENGNSQGGRVYSIEGKSATLNGEAGGGGARGGLYLKNNRIRRLTPTEFSRLQTIPETYRWECSDAQQYKMLGNGWTVEVIKHILSFLPDIEKYKHSQYESNSNSLPAPTKATIR